MHTEEIPNNHVPTNLLTSTNVVTTSKNEMDNQAQSMKKICSNQLPSIEMVHGRFILLMNSRYYINMDDLKAQVMKAYHLATHDFEKSVFQ